MKRFATVFVVSFLAGAVVVYAAIISAYAARDIGHAIEEAFR